MINDADDPNEPEMNHESKAVKRISSKHSITSKTRNKQFEVLTKKMYSAFDKWHLRTATQQLIRVHR